MVGVVRREDLVGNGSLSFGSQDGGSERSCGEESVVATDEEGVDANGETEDREGGGGGAAGAAFANVDFGMQIEVMRQMAEMKMRR